MLVWCSLLRSSLATITGLVVAVIGELVMERWYTQFPVAEGMKIKGSGKAVNQAGWVFFLDCVELYYSYTHPQCLQFITYIKITM